MDLRLVALRFGLVILMSAAAVAFLVVVVPRFTGAVASIVSMVVLCLLDCFIIIFRGSSGSCCKLGGAFTNLYADGSTVENVLL